MQCGLEGWSGELSFWRSSTLIELLGSLIVGSENKQLFAESATYQYCSVFCKGAYFQMGIAIYCTFTVPKLHQVLDTCTWYLEVLGTWYQVLSTWYQVLWYQVVSAWYQVVGTWYQVLDTKYGTWYQVLGTWCQVLGTKHLVLGTKYLVLGT